MHTEEEPSNRHPASGHPGRASLAQVAAAARVSPSTVSHALNGTRAVRAETRERVARAVEQLGYVQHRVARAKRRTAVVGVAFDGIADTPFAGRIMRGAQEVAREHGTLLLVVDSDGDPELEERHLRSLAERRVDGILLARNVHQEVDRPAGFGDIPVVLIGATPESGWIVPAMISSSVAIARRPISRCGSAMVVRPGSSAAEMTSRSPMPTIAQSRGTSSPTDSAAW